MEKDCFVVPYQSLVVQDFPMKKEVNHPSRSILDCICSNGSVCCALLIAHRLPSPPHLRSPFQPLSILLGHSLATHQVVCIVTITHTASSHISFSSQPGWLTSFGFLLHDESSSWMRRTVVLRSPAHTHQGPCEWWQRIALASYTHMSQVG